MTYRHHDYIATHAPLDWSTGVIAVAYALARYMDDRGACWPSVPRLARDVRLTERSTQRALAQLITDGWIERTVRGGRGKRADRVTNGYTFTGHLPHARRATLDELVASGGLIVAPVDNTLPETRRGDADVTASTTQASPRESRRGDADVANGVTQASPRNPYETQGQNETHAKPTGVKSRRTTRQAAAVDNREDAIVDELVELAVAPPPRNSYARKMSATPNPRWSTL